MPHFPKPFFRKQTKSWYLQLDAQWIPLGKDEEKAFRKHHGIMAARRELVPEVAVVYLIDAFLEWTKNNREESTFEWYLFHLNSFCQAIGPDIRTCHLKPIHVTRWLDKKYKGRSDNYRHSAIRTVQRAMNWAVKQGILETSPVKSVEKPTPKSTVMRYLKVA